MRRIELERRWGPFLPKDAPASEASTPLATDAAPVAVKTVDFSGFSSDQMQRAIDTYLAQAQAPDGSRGPMPRARRVPEAAAVVAVGHGVQAAVVPQRSDLPSTPEQKREVARAALRLRFSQYRALVRAADPAYVARVLELQDERRQRRLQILEFVAKSTPRGAHGLDVVTHCRNVIEIDAERQRRLEALKSWYREQKNALSATRTAPLSWRAWLHDQSMRGDPGALAALRGIVYQAGRDALGNWAPDSTGPVSSDPGTLTPTQRYQQLMERLLEQERKEVAIRSADEHAARPFEVDALFANDADMRWRVTGNGNIAYSKANGTHLFTDRGNRITFDRVQVSDDAIRLALTHAQKKFGDVLTLSGNDAVFSARMARLADDMGLTILNPELQAVITRHRTARNGQATQAAKAPLRPSPAGAPSTSVGRTEPEPDLGAHAVRATAALEVPASEEPLSVAGVLAKLRAAVLSLDPRAEFEIADPDPRKGGYYGKVVCVLDADAGFAQRTGRGVYTLHSVAVPVHPVGEVIDVRYHDGVAVAKLLGPDQDLGRG